MRRAALLAAALLLSPAAAAARDFHFADTPLHGSELLAYLVGCALPPCDAATLDTPAGPARLAGSLGLAPGWRDRALTPDEARRVSACLLARTKAFGATVEISMRADPRLPDPAPALRADAGERAAFPLHEGAFSGDLFAPGAPARVCQGRAAIETPDLLRAALRVCALASGAATPDGRPLSECGFVVTGPCGADTPPDAIHVYLRTPDTR